MTFDVVILGAAGYGGGELLRLLLEHPHCGRLFAVSHSHAGQPIHAAHPALRGFLEASFVDEMNWVELAQSEHPVVLSAQPHGALAHQLPALEAAWAAAGIRDRLILVDLSGDFRLQDAAAFALAYGGPHPCPEYLPQFVYGCPEAHGKALGRANRIANPGCFATALNLALLPLARLDLGFVAVSAATGSSGSGGRAQSGTHHPERAQDLRAYKVLCHQHQPEVLALLTHQGARPFPLAFVPHSVPLARGIFATAQFPLPAGETRQSLLTRFTNFYRDHPFVRLVEASPRVLAVAGTNMAELAFHADSKSAVVLVALDNLGKGMAGQALQNLNLALGLNECTGLWRPGRWP